MEEMEEVEETGELGFLVQSDFYKLHQYKEQHRHR